MNGVDTMIIDKVNDYLNSHSSSTTLLELCFYIKKNIHRQYEMTRRKTKK